MGASIMSETQYQRLENLILAIKDDLGTVKTDVEVIKTTMKDYQEKAPMVARHDTAIELLKTDCEHIKANCTQIQQIKKDMKAQPDAVKTGVMVGSIIAIISGAISLVVNLLT